MVIKTRPKTSECQGLTEHFKINPDQTELKILKEIEIIAEYIQEKQTSSVRFNDSEPEKDEIIKINNKLKVK